MNSGVGTGEAMAPALSKNLILALTIFDVPCYRVTCIYVP